MNKLEKSWGSPYCEKTWYNFTLGDLGIGHVETPIGSVDQMERVVQ